LRFLPPDSCQNWAPGKLNKEESMNTVKWWQWLCVGLLAAACSLATTGCSDDNGDEDVPAAPTVIVVTNRVNGTTRTNTVVATNPPAATPAPAPAAKTTVLWDSDMALNYGDTQEFKAALPADGTVAITASWTAIDLIAGGAPIDCPIQFRVNRAMLSDHNSPYSWSGQMSNGEFCELVVKNNSTDTRATIHVRAVFTPG
jgi:hypothetical protein